MINKEASKDKLFEELPVLFADHIKNKRWSQAKYCYDMALRAASFLETTPEEDGVLFGIRGERGTILKEGLFREAFVMKAYEECCVKGKEGFENKQYEPKKRNA